MSAIDQSADDRADQSRPHCSNVPSPTNPSANVVTAPGKSLGKHCDSLGIGLTMASVKRILQNEESDVQVVQEKAGKNLFTYGVAHELLKALEKITNVSKSSSFCKVVNTFFDFGVSVCIENLSVNDAKNLPGKFQSVKYNYQKLNKFKDKAKLTEFTSLVAVDKFFGAFLLPRDSLGSEHAYATSHTQPSHEPKSKKQQRQCPKLAKVCQKIATEVDEYRATSEAYKEIAIERALLLSRVSQLEEQQVNVPNDKNLARREKRKTAQIRQQVNVPNDKNLARREKRKTAQIRTLRQKLKSIKGKLSISNSLLSHQSAVAERKLMAAKKQVSYQKKKVAQSTDSAKVKRLQSSLQAKNRLLSELEDTVNELVSREEGTLKTFEGGKYKENIREVYQHLMSMNISSRNCETIVRTILSKLAGLEPERLPKSSFANEMMLEARGLAQLQVHQAFLGSEGATLCSDGTSKHGHHYGAYDISFSEGKTYTLGVRQTADGTAATTLDVLVEVLQDLISMGLDKNLCLGQFLVSIKNVMSDRHTVQKKFNGLFADFRASFLPVVKKEWDSLDSAQQGKAIMLNEFFCGMHFVVGLAEQAALTTKAWEIMIFREERMGAAAVPGFAGKEECGTERLVRTVCRSVHERACEKSGKPLEFRAFLAKETPIKDVPLAPFIGNRFNILFHNGAGVYHLHKFLRIFFDRYKSVNNLMTEVNADLNIPQYHAGVRALGIIDKVITTPLWRALEKESHVLGMNGRYTRMEVCLQKWSQDATELMHGTDILFDDIPVKKDAVYESLMQSCELDEMTKQLLEMQCSSFLVLTRRMLSDHLPGGKYSRTDENIVRETQSVPTTNTSVERDFGMLGQLMRLKPSASTIALEGIIMYRKNKTSDWSASLEESERSKFLEMARRSAVAQREVFRKRLATIRESREKKELSKKEALEKREEQQRVRKSLLLETIETDGGLSRTLGDLDQRLSTLPHKQQRLFIQNQLKFRRYVLGAPNVGGLLNLSSAGKAKTVDELRDSLVEVMEMGNLEVATAKSQSSEDVLGMVPADAVEAFKNRQTEPPAKKTTVPEAHPALSGGQSLDVGTSLTSPSSVPTLSINTLEHLVGKRVTHRKIGVVETFNGTVVGFKSDKFYIRYDGSDSVYNFTVAMIEEDLANGAMKLLPVDPQYLVGKAVQHLWLLDDGEEMWCNGRVISVVEGEGEDAMFEIIYDDSNEEGEEEEETFTLPLIHHYLNHELRFT